MFGFKYSVRNTLWQRDRKEVSIPLVMKNKNPSNVLRLHKHTPTEKYILPHVFFFFFSLLTPHKSLPKTRSVQRTVLEPKTKKPSGYITVRPDFDLLHRILVKRWQRNQPTTTTHKKGSPFALTVQFC